jgi:hypothetical protein
MRRQDLGDFLRWRGQHRGGDIGRHVRHLPSSKPIGY